jgi:adenylate kinase
MTTHHPRTHPIILLTGTPGTGKSTHAQLIAAASSSSSSSSSRPGGTGAEEEDEGCEFEHINVSELVKEKGFHEGWDEEWSSWVLDEDKVRVVDGLGCFDDGISGTSVGV